MGCGCTKKTTCTCSSCSPCTVESACPEASAALVIQNAWNIPSCGNAALLYIPGLTNVVIGTYISNPTYGTFKITAFNSVNSQITVQNDCFAENMAPGTVVPAYTSFVFSMPPTLTTYTDWTPILTSQNATVLSDVIFDTSEYFTIGTTVFFDVMCRYTSASVASSAMYISLPFTGKVLAGTGFICAVQPNGIPLGTGRWRVNNTDPSLAVIFTPNANIPLGPNSEISIQGRYEVA